MPLLTWCCRQALRVGSSTANETRTESALPRRPGWASWTRWDFGAVACDVVAEAEVVARTVDICDVEDFGAEVVARVVDFCDVVVSTTGFCVDDLGAVARVVVVGAVVVVRAVDFCEVAVLVVATGFCVDDCDVAVCVVGVGFAVGVTRCVVNVDEDVVAVFVVEVVEDVVVCEANCSRSSARLVLASRRAAR